MRELEILSALFYPQGNHRKIITEVFKVLKYPGFSSDQDVLKIFKCRVKKGEIL